MAIRDFQPGDWVVFRKQKTSSAPGPRARGTSPSSKGETYTYVVDKFWIIQEVRDDGQVVLRTRKGKEHTLSPDDPRLRHASWWEKWLFGGRYRAAEASKPILAMFR